jgi:hypothetical protein
MNSNRKCFRLITVTSLLTTNIDFSYVFNLDFIQVNNVNRISWKLFESNRESTLRSILIVEIATVIILKDFKTHYLLVLQNYMLIKLKCIYSLHNSIYKPSKAMLSKLVTYNF